MTEDNFDINEFVDGENWDDEEAVDYYIEHLMELFADSPEAQALREPDGFFSLFWVDSFLDYSLVEVGISPPEMTENDLREVLFELFPRKVSTPEGFDGEKVVQALCAFWSFLKREFGLPNADTCLRVLDDRTARRMDKEMNDPSNFGMAKTMVMMGAARGFDMTKQEDVDRWTAIYNEEIARSMGAPPGIGTPFPLPDEDELPASTGRSYTHRKPGKERRKHKLAKISRKKNRRK
ncbi:MAG: hypothetical protein KBH93_11370 [Anaerolineae bacterium]|nr:hypothetical protein [Anaerolineae bacterium]